MRTIALIVAALPTLFGGGCAGVVFMLRATGGAGSEQPWAYLGMAAGGAVSLVAAWCI